MSKSLLSLVAGVMLVPVVAEAAEPIPYYNPCEDISTVTTQGHGSKKWEVYNWNSNKAFRIAPVNSSTVGDAWVWTPELAIEDGKTYEVTFATGVQTKNGTLNFEAYFCSAPSAISSQKLVLKDVVPVNNRTYYTVYLEGDASKPYFGVYNMCKGNYRFFYVDEISIREVDGSVPAATTVLSATNPSGKNVSVSFNAPGKSLSGASLTSLSAVELYRNDVLIKTWRNPTPGQSLTFDDVASSLGEATYGVLGYFEGRPGKMATVSVTVGGKEADYKPTQWNDYNGHGTNYKALATCSPEGVNLEWEPFTATGTDSEGNPIPATYTVTRVQDGKVVADHIDACRLTDTDMVQTGSSTYTYKVKVHFGTTDRDIYTSNTLSLHNIAPFKPGMNQFAFYEFTIFDIDCGDASSWQLRTIDATRYTVAKTFATRVADEWLVSPGIDMEAGKTYRIDLDMFSQNLIPKNVGFEVKAGAANTVEAMTMELIESTVLSHTTPATYSGFYTPEEDCQIFIGIHTVNPLSGTSYDDIGMSAFCVHEVPGSLPLAPTDVKVNFSATDATKATISFVAPDKDVRNSALGTLSKIEVYKNDALLKTITDIAPGGKGELEIDVVVGEVANYVLRPYSPDGAGMDAHVQVMVLEPPYENTFPSKSSTAGYTVIDIHGTGFTWAYHNNAIRDYPSQEYGNDDYIVTPPIHLEGGKYYKVNFTSWLAREETGDYNQIEFLLGKAPTVEALTTKVIEPYTLHGTYSQAVLLKEYFTVEESGEYYLAWHATGPAYNSQEVYVDNFSISDKINPDVPDAVTDFKITPDPEGALTAELSFKLPTTDISGKDLTTANIYSYEIYRDGEYLTREFSKAIGSEQTYTDTNIPEGVHLYTVICNKNNKEPGREKEDVAFVGINIPGSVPFVKAVETEDKYGEVTITWDAPEYDINGFELNTTAITYTVGRLNTDLITGELSETIYEKAATGTSLTVQAMTKDDGQEFCRFFVRPTTAKGSSPKTMITRFMAVGEPYTLPLSESFSNYRPAIAVMQEITGDRSPASWGFNTMNPVTKVEAVDADNGLAIMEVMFLDGGARLFTGRVNITGQHPSLSLYVYNQSTDSSTDNNLLAIEAREPDGEFEELVCKSINEWTDGQRGWQKINVDLSSLVGKTVYLGFNATSKGLVFTHIDALTIAEASANDLAARTIEVPKVYVGLEHTVKATVRNMGTARSGDFKVNLVFDNEILSTVEDSGILPGEEKSYGFKNIITRENIGMHLYSVSVTYDLDTDLLDNFLSGKEFEVLDNDYPTVRGLAARDCGNALELSWHAPLIPDAPVRVTEDFDSYEAFSTMHTGGIGEWQLIDGDMGGIGGFQNFELPNVEKGSKQSFFVMDVNYGELSGQPRYSAHSGNHVLASSYNIDGSWTDDIVISPRLCGSAQTVSLWAKAVVGASNTSITISYSTTDTRMKSFTEVKRAGAIGEEWQEITFDLPEGALYFMISHYSYGCYYLFLDDISFIPEGAETLDLKAYNVYRDGAGKVASLLTDTKWTDTTPAEGDNTYTVTAVYDRGESPAEEVTMKYSGINGPGTATPAVKAIRGAIVVENATGLDVTVATASGMVKTSFVGSESDTIPATEGVYIVTVGTAVHKILVK